MKTAFALIAICSLIVGEVVAIPQTFGTGNGFFNSAGVAFEQFAAARATWQPGAELKGNWRVTKSRTVDGEQSETLELTLDAAVFGFPAAQVVAERSGKTIKHFVVRIDEAGRKAGEKEAKGELFARVLANITALAGEPKSISPSGERAFVLEAATVTARKSGQKSVVLEFTPAP